MKLKHFLLIISFSQLMSCRKFLDEKPSASLAIPTTVKDAQAVLDNAQLFNASWPYNMELPSDDYFVTTAEWQSRPANERNSYIWDDDVLNQSPVNAWSVTYNIVYTANLILDELRNGLSGTNPEQGNVKGQALFFRAFAFYYLSQLFATPFIQGSVNSQPGIPLRLDSDLNKPTVRASLQESYDQIVKDLEEAVTLLPDMQTVKTRPSKQAALTLLARTALIMGNYNKVISYSNEALAINHELLNFNQLNENLARPISMFNSEVHFHAAFTSALILVVQAKVDSLLYNQYHINDKRRTVYFRANANGTYTFKGSHEGAGRVFSGFTNGELYLMKAEALARTGKPTEAMEALNTLLLQRWKTGTFLPFVAGTAEEALQIIMTERRKELLFRGLRWSDLRRLNQNPSTGKTLTRIINNQTFTLAPGHPRYTFRIPDLVIQLTGIAQNE
jgi:starch-binding outer membrane protein, SusD/RagB family